MQLHPYPFQDWIKQIHINNPHLCSLAEVYFVVFSRFEYALKQAGFVKGHENWVQPDWDDFANSYSCKFRRRLKTAPQVVEAIQFFCHKPPRKQVLRNGNTLDWDYTDTDNNVCSGQEEPTLQWIVLMLRRVRNNLFHGSKKIFDGRTRDEQLLYHGLTLLRCLLEIDPIVKSHFLGGLALDILSNDPCSPNTA